MSQRPNVLFLFSDQHSPHVLGYAGNDKIHTPNIDRLAATGVVFDNAYCQNPLCVPSRMSLVSGQYCRSTGIYDNQHILQANSPTLPRALGASGYRTCLIGKSHFNGEQFHGYQQRPYGDLFGQAHQPDPRKTPENGAAGLGKLLDNTGPSGIPLPLTQTEICVAEAAKWLQVHVGLHRDQPFFLSVHFDKPHFPIRCPEEIFRRYEGKVEPAERREEFVENAVPFVRKILSNKGFHPEEEVVKRALAAYYGCVEWVDNAVGRIIDTLEYLGLADNTIVVYASDHGEMGSEKGAWQKTLFFEAAARVPLIISCPKRYESGRHVTDPVGLIDLFPTFCDITQTPIPEQCEGISLVPLLHDGGRIERDAIFCESTILKNPDYAGCMIRTGDWKYCYYIDQTEELYNLKEDPGEWNNLAKDPRHSTLVGELRSRVIAFWKPEEQMERFHSTPSMNREKHFYQFSNQFMLGDGTIVDGRP